MIETLRGPMRDYLRALGLYAVYTTADGKAHASAAPYGDIAAIMWTTQRGARAMAARLNKGTFKTIESAAAALRVRITQHADVIERAEHAVREVNTALAHAKARGDLQVFHRAFAEYRRRAAEHGVRAQSYARAYMRLRAALFVHAAKGEVLPSIAQLVPTALGHPPNALGAPRPRARKARRLVPEAGRQPESTTLKFTQ